MSYPEQVQIAADGSCVQIECNFSDITGPVLWVINDTIYNLYREKYPLVMRNGLHAISIPSIHAFFNNTTFQCLNSAINFLLGPVTRLYVLEGMYYNNFLKFVA